MEILARTLIPWMMSRQMMSDKLKIRSVCGKVLVIQGQNQYGGAFLDVIGTSALALTIHHFSTHVLFILNRLFLTVCSPKIAGCLLTICSQPFNFLVLVP